MGVGGCSYRDLYYILQLHLFVKKVEENTPG